MSNEESGWASEKRSFTLPINHSEQDAYKIPAFAGIVDSAKQHNQERQ